ncbi:MAG: phosphoribosylformylglycinamidine synthase I [Candidatus Thorarchaeota archaeon]|nr:MAG: phosphoribosylformylglycinamidine synthase I [Candidatus Thorarchaeota archaeon]
MAIAVTKFPGTNNAGDMIRALALVRGADPFLVTIKEGNNTLDNADGVVVLGGLIDEKLIGIDKSEKVGTLIDSIIMFAAEGRPVLGTSGGFHILIESGLLPGSLLPNESGRFLCRWVNVKVSDSCTSLTDGLEGLVLRLPISHARSQFECTEGTLKQLRATARIAFRYCDKNGEITTTSNPNGSTDGIAGIVNDKGNVMGMIPSPERASRPILGSEDGQAILESFVRVAGSA